MSSIKNSKMAKKKIINSKILGILLIASLIFTYVLPQIKLGSFSWIGTLITLIVALILLIKD